MLLRITNHCTMGCAHCLTDSRPDGEHMTRETFGRALAFIKRYEPEPSAIIVSGGEPTDHPDVCQFVRRAQRTLAPRRIVLATSGEFLGDSRKDAILSLGVMIQVTNDPRYYPRSIRMLPHPRVRYETQIQTLDELGRARVLGMRGERVGPNCYNLRALARGRGFVNALWDLRCAGKHCTPAIEVDGTISAGESTECQRIGTVDSSPGELERGLRKNCHCPAVARLPGPMARLFFGGEPLRTCTLKACGCHDNAPTKSPQTRAAHAPCDP